MGHCSLGKSAPPIAVLLGLATVAWVKSVPLSWTVGGGWGGGPKINYYTGSKVSDK